MHGGKSPQARRAAELRRAEAEATATLEVLWDPNAAPIGDPIEALQQLAGQIKHAVNVLGARVEMADLDGPTGLAWARAMRELRLALEGLQRLDLQERHIKLEQGRAQLVTMALMQVLDHLQLLPADRDRAIRTFLAGIGRGDQVVEAGSATVRGEVEA